MQALIFSTLVVSNRLTAGFPTSILVPSPIHFPVTARRNFQKLDYILFADYKPPVSSNILTVKASLFTKTYKCLPAPTLLAVPTPLGIHLVITAVGYTGLFFSCWNLKFAPPSQDLCTCWILFLKLIAFFLSLARWFFLIFSLQFKCPFFRVLLWSFYQKSISFSSTLLLFSPSTLVLL